jgi:hypothetical protein
MRVNLVLNTGIEGFLVGGGCRCESDQSGLRVTLWPDMRLQMSSLGPRIVGQLELHSPPRPIATVA